MKTPQQFVDAYKFKAFDYDGAYGVQCVDGFKAFCLWADIPVKATPNNYADGYWFYRDQLGFSKWFEYITDKNQVRKGDWCIWAQGSSCVISHIAMYWEGNTYFGERQNGNLFFCFADLKNDWVGALRWKGFDMIGSWEKRIDMYAGTEIIVCGCPDGDRLTFMAASEPKKIQDVDTLGTVYDMKLNANFFSMENGEQYGIRCGINVWEVPRQGQFIYYAVKYDGTTEVGNDSDFWYQRGEIECAGSPAMVLMHNGQDTEYISPLCEWRRTYACCQSLLIRTADRFLFAITKGKLTPDQCRAWAKSIGALDLVFNDAGGSSTLQYGYDVYSGTGEYRKIPNVWAFYHDADDTIELPLEAISDDSEPITEQHEEVITETEQPQETLINVVHEVDDMEEKTVKNQVAKLIDVKSIITIMVMFCLCYLVINGQEIPQNFMQVLIAIMTFYFGYQSNKGEK